MDRDPRDLLMAPTHLQAGIHSHSFPYSTQSCSQGWQPLPELDLACTCQGESSAVGDISAWEVRKTKAGHWKAFSRGKKKEEGKQGV